MIDAAAQPRSGALGVWDRIVGPGMPADETRLVLIAGSLGALFAAWRFGTVAGPGWAAVLAALIGFDVIGGAVCNATQTTKRWYAQSPRAQLGKFAFVLPHLGYVALIAWLWRGAAHFDMRYFALFSIVLIGGAAAVLVTPARLAAPMAFGVFLAALTAIIIAAGLTPGLEWFAPGLLLKLLLGHLVPPTPPADPIGLRRTTIPSLVPSTLIAKISPASPQPLRERQKLRMPSTRVDRALAR